MERRRNLKREILATLRGAEHPLSAGEVAAVLGLHRTTVEQRLHVLWIDRAVARSGAGTRGNPRRWAALPARF